MVEEIRVGDRVRAYDYECRDITGPKACYTEGVVVEMIDDGNIPDGRYVIKVDRDVWTGKDMKVRVGHNVYPAANGRVIYPAKVYMNRVVCLSRKR